VVSVFVTSSDATNGITHPSQDQQDTVRDIQAEISTLPALKLVSAGDHPTVTGVVMGRQTTQRFSAALGRAVQNRSIHVKLLYLDTVVQMTASAQDDGTNPANWQTVAKAFGKQLDDWIAANRDWLKAPR
jgi:hypothetical protein